MGRSAVSFGLGRCGRRGTVAAARGYALTTKSFCPFAVMAQDKVGPIDFLDLFLSIRTQVRVIRKPIRVPGFCQIAVGLFDLGPGGVGAKAEDSQCLLDVIH